MRSRHHPPYPQIRNTEYFALEQDNDGNTTLINTRTPCRFTNERMQMLLLGDNGEQWINTTRTTTAYTTPTHTYTHTHTQKYILSCKNTNVILYTVEYVFGCATYHMVAGGCRSHSRRRRSRGQHRSHGPDAVFLLEVFDHRRYVVQVRTVGVL